MKIQETVLNGVYTIDIEKKEDERGFFARNWCVKELTENKLSSRLVQCSISYNRKCGTLRGMHYQLPPYGEIKLVRCQKGAIFDVVIDLRKDSPTYKKWVGVELTAENYRMLYIPEYCAHGFQTLSDDTEIYYMISEFYHPEAQRGILYNDPEFKISWPIGVSMISDKDKNWPLFTD